MICRSQKSVLLALCSVTMTLVLVEEFLQEFDIVITRRTKPVQEEEPDVVSGGTVLRSEMLTAEDLKPKPPETIGIVGEEPLIEIDHQNRERREFINQTAEHGDTARLENASITELVNNRRKDGPNSDSGVRGNKVNISEDSVRRDGINSDNDTRSADDVSYDDRYDEDRERLMRSPYIYNERAENKRLSITPIMTSVKKVSGYMPYEESWVKKNFKSCMYNKCQFIGNMSQADAVLFGGGRIRDHVIPNFYRPPGQRWIFYTYDPAANNYALDRQDVVSNFNWTMSYQLDSDYPFLFGRLLRRDLPDRDYDQIYDGKVNHTAWFVSHCHTWSKREIYVKRMQKILPVDIFGGCSDRRCGAIHYRTHDSTLCLPMLSKSYKFYLAFENSFCKDYITEKFFKLFDEVDVIPVVRGGFNYKKYLPSGIFVDADDFKTPEALAHYLVQLGNNKVEYVKMLKRKNRWVSTSAHSFPCNVCEALHTNENKTGFIPNLKTKFNGDPPYCWTPRDLGPPPD